MAEMMAISLSSKLAVALSRTAAFSFLAIRPGIAAASRDLDLLSAFLRFADSRRGTDECVKVWVDQVRDVGFELEDIADEYTFLSGNGLVHACTDVMAWFALFRRLRKARERLRSLSAGRELYGIRPAEASASGPAPDAVITCRNLSEAAHFIGEKQIFGFGEHMRLLMELLTEDAEPRRTVIAVCGMPGAGKTTLATNVYKKVTGGSHFDCAAWVSVSNNFTPDDLLRTIVKELHRDARGGAPQNVEEMDYRSLAKALNEHLAQKRYLLLLDDVWDADAWFQLRNVLVDSGTRSRIVITTRIPKVAALASVRTIRLDSLSRQEAWSLFCSTTFREVADRECPDHLQHWASKILDRCYGLPLAIVSVGNLLALKEKTQFAWKNVHDSLVWDESSDQETGRVWSILNLSIDDLPYHLYRCFLYCSIYPEDFFFKRKILIREWIADGLVEEKGHVTMEEVADGYVNELVQRNLLLVALKNEYGRAKRLHIHDLFREIIVHRSKDERFFHQLSSRSTKMDPEHKIRHLTLYKCRSDHQSGPNMASLRSFYVFKSELDASLLSDFRLLTMLSLWNIKTSKLPSAVAKLRNLRYLGIRSTYIEELPKELGKLRNLQTLDAKWSMIKILPSSITKLKNLRHLILFRRQGTDFMHPAPGTAIALPDGLENLRCLQTLKYVQADKKVVRSLGSLEQMRSLELFGVDERILVDLPSALSKMSFLLRFGIVSSDATVTLDLESFSPPPVKLKTLAITGKLTGGKLPSWFGSLTNLGQLHLHSCELGEDSIAILSSLPRLLHLSLTNAYTERSLTFAEGCFPVLRELSLQGLPNLTRIEFQKKSLADLRLLMLGRCLELTEIPQSIENLLHLGNVELFEMEHILDGEGYGANHRGYPRVTIVKNLFLRNGRSAQ